MENKQLRNRVHKGDLPAPAKPSPPLLGLDDLLAPQPVDGKVVLPNYPEALLEHVKRINLGQVADKVHGAIYDADRMVKGNGALMVDIYLASVLRGMAPREPIEQMPVIQMTLCHQRVVRLSLKAADQAHRDNVAVVNYALDQAMNAFRRAMLALKEYRSPRE